MCLCPDVPDEFQQIDDSRIAAIDNTELSSMHIDISALHKSRPSESETLRENDYTIFSHGKSEYKPQLNVDLLAA